MTAVIVEFRLSQTTKEECFTEVVNVFKPLTIAKSSHPRRLAMSSFKQKKESFFRYYAPILLYMFINVYIIYGL